MKTLLSCEEIKTMRLLLFLADDDIWFSELLATEIKKYGYSVRTFSGATQVLERAEAESPALFLLGIAAQGAIDVGLYYALRGLPSLATIPIILLSSSAGDGGIYGLDVGADAYLAKPVSPPELIVQIKRLLGPSDPFPSSLIRVGPLEIDSDSMTVSVSGKQVLLNTTEFRLLEYIA